MSKMIQLRNVPDSLHQQLKSRAALAGMSLSDYLIREARKIAERPSSDEILARLARRARISPRLSPADAVRKERDAR
jgi:plasmid stability protein